MWGARAAGAGTPFDWPEAIGHARQPYASLPSSVANPGGLAIGCFAWLDESGVAWNSLQANALLGLVLAVTTITPQFRYFRGETNGFPQIFIRGGYECVLCGSGDFGVRFPNGANGGARVWAEPTTGLPYSADGGGFVATPWTVIRGGAPGARLRISSFIQPFN